MGLELAFGRAPRPGGSRHGALISAAISIGHAARLNAKDDAQLSPAGTFDRVAPAALIRGGRLFSGFAEDAHRFALTARTAGRR